MTLCGKCLLLACSLLWHLNSIKPSILLTYELEKGGHFSHSRPFVDPVNSRNLIRETVLQDYGASERGVKSRAGVVDRNAQQIEWQPNSPSVIEIGTVILGLGASWNRHSTRRNFTIASRPLANIHVLVQMDKRTAIIMVPDTLPRSQPGLQNFKIDGESKTLQSSAEWMQKRSICVWVLVVDRFATRLNNKLGSYISWPPDLFAITVVVVQLQTIQRSNIRCILSCGLTNISIGQEVLITTSSARRSANCLASNNH